MRNDERFPQKQRRPHCAQAQIVVPKNVAPLYQAKQLRIGRSPNDSEPVVIAVRSLSDNGHFVAHSAKLVREHAAHRFNSTDARGEGV